MKKNIQRLIRPNILRLTPYSSARSEYSGKAEIMLDANENPCDNGYNRYPDPLQRQLKTLVGGIKGVAHDKIFIGNGSDEAIDLMFRIFCRPGGDNAVSIAPSYGMYAVAAAINDVEMRDVPLGPGFSLPSEALIAACDENTKLMFVCSPNNPTGNAFPVDEILALADKFDGILVVDEAYIDFSSKPSLVGALPEHPNLVVLQTLSKAWGMAGLRVGFAFASPEIIKVMSAVKYPYNINTASQRKAMEMIKLNLAPKQIADLLSQRESMAQALAACPWVVKVYPSDANFLLVKLTDPAAAYRRLLDEGVVVRDRSKVAGCDGCLRITIGTPAENARVLEVLGADPTIKGAGKEHPRTAPSRTATVRRTTRETDITVSVDLEGKSPSAISTGLRFFDHMLDQIVHHAGISLSIDAHGDLDVDAHHTIEDTAITLGEALRQALGDKRGIERYGFTLPMDECRAQVLIDLGGRIDFDWYVRFTVEKVGDVPSEMFGHFFKSLAAALRCNLHIIAKGENNHHLAEAVFKAFARALRMAVRREPGSDRLPSSKGELW